MNMKRITAGFASAALGGLVFSSVALAQSYGVGPECEFGSSYDAAHQRCVYNHARRFDHDGWAYREQRLYRAPREDQGAIRN